MSFRERSQLRIVIPGGSLTKKWNSANSACFTTGRTFSTICGAKQSSTAVCFRVISRHSACSAQPHSQRQQAIQLERKQNIRCDFRCNFWPPKAHRDTICSNFVVFLGLGSCTGSLENIGLSAVRSVAQPGSALDWGSRGRRFESGHSDHLNQQLSPCPASQELKLGSTW